MLRLSLILSPFMLLLLAVPLGAQTPTVNGVLNNASSPGLSPGVLAMVFGTNLGPATPVMGSPVPSQTVSVTVGGKDAFVLVALSTQINLQIPADLPAGAATLVVRTAGGVSAPFNVTLATHSPGLFSTWVSTPNPPGIISRANGSGVSASNPAIPGEVLILYAVGLGPTNPAATTGPTPATPLRETATKPTLTIGQTDAPVIFSGLPPGMVGTYQVNFNLPGSIAEGSQLLTLKIAGFTSNTVTIPVGKPIPLVSRLVNGASFGSAGTAAPGSFVTLFAANLGGKDKLSGFPATDFEGVSVTFNGTAAPLFHLVASAGQINLVTPSELPETGTVNVQVRTPIGASANYTLRMSSAVPGIFRARDPAQTSRLNALALFANTAWLVIPDSTARAFGIPGCAGANPAALCGQPAAVGDNIQIYVTGLGKVTAGGAPGGSWLGTGQVAPLDANPLYLLVQKPVVTVGDVPAEVQFAGIAPGFAGFYQINIQVPRSAPAGDDVPVKIAMPNGTSDTATIAVKP